MAFWGATSLSKKTGPTKQVTYTDPSLSPPNSSSARAYTDVNQMRGREYWDYKNFILQWGSTLGDYEVGKKLGRGKVLYWVLSLPVLILNFAEFPCSSDL